MQREDLPFLRKPPPKIPKAEELHPPVDEYTQELDTPTGNAATIAAEQKANRDEATRKAKETYSASRSAVCLCAV
jgi:hypothetical protein